MPAKNTKPAAPAPRKAGKRGRLDPVPVVGVAELKQYATAPLPAPPPSVAPPKVADWGMDFNDQFGDCVTCGAAHSIAAWDVEVSEKDAVPTDDQVLAQYKTLTGCVTAGDAKDTGLVETTFLQQWMTTGMFGDNKLAAFAPVNHATILDIHQAIDAYGVCFVGGNIPASAETQFENNEPWTVAGDPPIGGHCWIFVGYDATYLTAVTWGATQLVSYPFWQKFGDEAYAIIPQAFVEAGKGPTLNLAALQADLASLNVTPKAPKRHWWQAIFG